MNIKECFEILELRVDATLEQVQKAYRTLMMVCHPDNQRHNKIDLRLIQRPALFDSRPLLNAFPATDAVACWAIGFFTWVDALVFLLEDVKVI